MFTGPETPCYYPCPLTALRPLSYFCVWFNSKLWRIFEFLAPGPCKWTSGAGYFAAVRLGYFSAESLTATTVYSHKDFYKISLITGHATYHHPDHTYTIVPGECVLVFINGDVPYRWEVHEGVCNGYSCMFTADFLDKQTYYARWMIRAFVDFEGSS